MRVLQLSFKPLFPIHDGGAHSVYYSLRAMQSAGIYVDTLAIRPRGSILSELTAGTGSGHCYDMVYVNTTPRWSGAFISLFKKNSYLSSRFYSHRFAHKLEDVLKRGYDVVLLENLYMAHYLDAIRRNSDARVVLRCQNVEHHLWQMIATVSMRLTEKIFIRLQAKKLGAFETSVAERMDGIITLSSGDEQFFRTCNKNIVTVMPGFGDAAPIKNSSGDLRFYHLGSMDWMPNIEGMNWFLQSIWPLLHKRFPNLQMTIAGKSISANFRRQVPADISVPTLIPDALKFLQAQDVLLVPLLSGSGVRIKIMEAILAGKTIISTHLGASGLGLVAGQHYMEANTPEEFLTCVTRCMNDPAATRRFGMNARMLTGDRWNFRQSGKQMRAFFDSLVR